MASGDRQPELSIRGRLPDREAARHPLRAAHAPSIRRIGSRELMGASGQLIIRHAGDEYRLRVTSKGKLILTK
jgi:hemin uptake protein HemP